MPRYLKDTKIAIWKDNEPTQDEYGAWHNNGRTFVGSVWANVKGVDYSEFYALHARWAEPTYKFTVTRPSWGIVPGDHVRYQGRFFEVKTVDDLTGKVGRDMKLTCQLESRYQE